MKKNEIIARLREYVTNNLSPTEQERSLISEIYTTFRDLFSRNCIQIGSFPRFTAIRPIHDLDMLYIIGEWDDENLDPNEILQDVKHQIDNEFNNPTDYKLDSSLQTHSVTVIFTENGNEVFSIDIVPAYIFGKNEFDLDTYKVPEIANIPHGPARQKLYKALLSEQEEMPWIVSDPRGYIEIAKNVNESNNDFRKTVKLIKAWKSSCKSKDEDFKIKSFHIEQIVTNYFQKHPNADIFSGIFEFFITLPNWLKEPKIPDRVDNSRFIDDYVSELSPEQKSKIIHARDCFLKKLEEITPSLSIEELIDGCYYERASQFEQFMFDFGIPTFIDGGYSFEIFGRLEREGYRPDYLPVSGEIDIDRKIYFDIKKSKPKVDSFYWKVKNDNGCPEPRGEITKDHTKQVPEHTKYGGTHYVECYAVLNDVCVAKARQYVILEYYS